jgi:hypothetical protein
MTQTGLETMFSDGFTNTVGDPIFLGLILVGFLGAFVMLQGLRLDGKMLILVPALLLASAFIPFLPVLLGLALGFVLWLAISKMDAR